MQKFHMLLGQPSYGPNPGLDLHLLDLVDRMLKVARSARTKSSDPIDIPYSTVMAHVPCVPSWTVDQIKVMEAQENADPWIAERYWFSERVQEADRAGKDLANLLSNIVAADWYPESDSESVSTVTAAFERPSSEK